MGAGRELNVDVLLVVYLFTKSRTHIVGFLVLDKAFWLFGFVWWFSLNWIWSFVICNFSACPKEVQNLTLRLCFYLAHDQSSLIPILVLLSVDAALLAFAISPISPALL